MLKSIIAAAVFTLSAGIASAQSDAAKASGPYIGVTYSALSIKNTTTSGGDVTLSTVGALVGYDINAAFAIEARVAGGVGSDTIRVLGNNVDVKFDRLAGIYAKWSAPIGTQFDIYGLAGVTSGKIKATFRGFTETETQSSGSFGVGLTYNLNRSSAVSVEYTRLYSDTNALSVVSKFSF